MWLKKWQDKSFQADKLLQNVIASLRGSRIRSGMTLSQCIWDLIRNPQGIPNQLRVKHGASVACRNDEEYILCVHIRTMYAQK